MDQLKSAVEAMDKKTAMALSVDEKNEMLDELSNAVDNLQTLWDNLMVDAYEANDVEFADELQTAFDRLLEESELA